MSEMHSHRQEPALLLQVQAYRNEPSAEAPAVRIGAAGATLGRAPENDLVLHDPGKYISRVHARVRWHDGRFYLSDEGVNPSIVDGRPLGAGAEAALADGARIVVGDYVLLARLESAAAAAPDATILQGPQAAQAASLPPFEPPAAPALPALPLFEPPARVAAALTDSGPADGLAGALAAARILDSDGGAASGPDPLGLDLFAGLQQVAVAPPYRGAESDHAGPEVQVFAMPAAHAPAIPADYDPLVDLLAPVAPPPAPPALQPVHERPAATAVPAVPAVHVAPAAPDGAVLAALLDGLGLPDLRPAGPPEALAREVGQMLQAAVAGTIDVLMARALTKRESRIDMTLIAARANNPLKFFPDAASALTQMLGARQPGYLPPLAALGGAFDDLKAHELAVIAGMRAALAAVTQRFDPARIESRLAPPGGVDRMFAHTRKARLWDRLVETYAELASDADEDLQRLFGERFAAAYDAQVDRLRRERG